MGCEHLEREFELQQVQRTFDYSPSVAKQRCWGYSLAEYRNDLLHNYKQLLEYMCIRLSTQQMLTWRGL